MWGALSCTLKAVAAKQNRELRSHKRLGEFASELALTEKDKNIWMSYTSASNLHQNFYESNLGEREIRILIDDVRKVIGKLMLQMGYRAP